MADSTATTTKKEDVGGVEGPEAMYVKLIASDGHEFVMKRDHALTSGTIKNMLSGPGEYFKRIQVCVVCSVCLKLGLKANVTFYIKRTLLSRNHVVVPDWVSSKHMLPWHN